MWPINELFGVLPLAVSVTYCSLIKLNIKKRGLLRQAIHSGKEIWIHSIDETEKVSRKLYYGISHALSTCSADLQYRYRYKCTVCTDSA